MYFEDHSTQCMEFDFEYSVKVRQFSAPQNAHRAVDHLDALKRWLIIGGSIFYVRTV